MLTKVQADAFILKYTAAKPVSDAVSGAPTWLTGRALDLWNQDPQDRSKHDAKFFLACLRLGRTEDEAKVATLALPGGKAHKDGRQDDSYWTSTFTWARKQWSLDKAALEFVRKAKSHDALLERFIDAMARIHDEWPDKYERALKRMRQKGVRVGKLEKAIQAARARDSVPEWDSFARHAVSEGNAAGWWYKGKAGWVAYSSADWARNLTGRGVPPAIAAKALSDDPWTLVAEPFKPEELPGRRWNRDSAQLAHAPKAGPHAMWDQLFRVIGRGLDEAAKNAGFKSGGQYLFLWVASVIQRPGIKLPYLFFHGAKQEGGKSTFHEALKGLLRRGYQVANEALENTRGFNGELHGAVICVGDEISVGRKAYKRIKQWTTGEQILIHPKGRTAYQLDNFTHWIQTGNSIEDCPLLDGDTRIVACHVWAVDKEDKIEKEVMLKRLLDEGPAITHSLLNVELPPVTGRLGLPILTTADKQSQQKANLTPLESWLELQGDKALSWSDRDLANSFLETRPGPDWDHSKVLREAPRNLMRLRRLYQVIVKACPWKGSTADFRNSLGSGLVGDWADLAELGHALRTRVWPGVRSTCTQSGMKKKISFEVLEGGN